jgi:hypothetical protein
MEFIIDFSFLSNLSQQGILTIAWYFFSNGGWIIFVLMFLKMGYEMWIFGRQDKWFSTNSFVILAVDIPKDTEQTPKAVEQLFSTLSGAHSPLSKKDDWKGIFQLWFSFEIISIDGYIQFLIRTPSQWRDLVESSIYSQYPDAEITEVEDYIDTVPDKYPNETHKIWGTEVIPVFNESLPIKTYRFFEDMVSGEFKDPIASILETMSKIQLGEQVWLQILVKPTGFDWVKRSMAAAYKLAGKKVKPKKGFWDKLISPITSLFFLSTGEEMFFQTGGGVTSKDKKDEMASLMLYLTPGERTKVEAIEQKASKMGFECKIRLIYISPLAKYSAARVVSSVFGSIKQFADLNLNSFYPDPHTKTSIVWWFIKYREARRREMIMQGYKQRSGWIGHNWFILNTEELATLWHFPSKYIKAPLLQRTESKKAEPPTSLPKKIGLVDSKAVLTQQLSRQLIDNQPISPTSETKLPIQTPKEYNFKLDNDYYEEKFAKKDGQHNYNHRHKSEPPSNLPHT